MALLLKDIYARLLENGHKMTPQRWAIISIFLLNKGRHLSADDVYGMLRETHPNQGIATVYRTLELLQEVQVIKRLDFGDGRARYELNEGGPHRHHHLICSCCDRIEQYEDDEADALLAALAQKIGARTGFAVDDHITKFYGLCGECQRKQKQKRS